MNGGNGREHADREALRERLSAYLDGELAPDDVAALERHLATCAECRDELAGLREVRTLLRALPQPALPRSFVLPETTARSAPRTPAPTPLPTASVRARPRRANGTVPALARAAQWVGALAACFGLLLIVATAVVSGGAGRTSTAASSTMGGASAPQHTAANPQQTATNQGQLATAVPQRTPTHPAVVSGGGTPVPTPTEALGGGTANTPAVPRTPGVEKAPEQASATAAEPFPVVPVAGAGLLAGGLVLFASGSVAARRRQRPQRRTR